MDVHGNLDVEGYITTPEFVVQQLLVRWPPLLKQHGTSLQTALIIHLRLSERVWPGPLLGL